MTDEAIRRVRWLDVVYFVLAACAAPFVIVGLSRVTPWEWPLFTPFVILLAIAAVLWMTSLRSMAAGLAVGTIGFAVFTYYLFTELEQGLRGLD